METPFSKKGVIIDSFFVKGVFAILLFFLKQKPVKRCLIIKGLLY